MRHEPLAYLPALIALALAGTGLPARAQIDRLCSGAPLPNQGPNQGPDQRPDPGCDQACHAGTTRVRKPGSGRL